jgi:hypothetical protein
MKTIMGICLFITFFVVPFTLSAQKDSLHLVCPFVHGSGREPKEAFSWDPPDQKVVMISQVDSIIHSCVTGEVVKVADNGEGAYELVIFSQGFYFWYNNIIKTTVQIRQTVKAGQNIGVYKPGDELEFRMYKEMKNNEAEMMDPRNWLECKVPKSN